MKRCEYELILAFKLKCHREGLICAWLRFNLTPKRFFSKRRINKSNHDHRSASFPMEHRSSTCVCHFRCFISSFIVRCPACLQSFSIRILLSHQTTRMLLRHMLIKTCNFYFRLLVNLYVSAPSKITAVLFVPSHAWVSSNPPRPLLTTHNAPGYLESSTSRLNRLPCNHHTPNTAL